MDHHLVDLGNRLGGFPYRDAHRVLQVTGTHVTDIRGNGGGKKKRLPFRSQAFSNFL
jgi:hypothetical protein